VDGAFYLYADVSQFTGDSFGFAKTMLEQALVAVTPGIDFDPFTAATSSVSATLDRPTICVRQWPGSDAGSRK